MYFSLEDNVFFYTTFNLTHNNTMLHICTSRDTYREGWGTQIITCSSSPPAGGSNRTNMSTISATANSDWPTPAISNHSFIENIQL